MHGHGTWTIQIVKRSDAAKGFVLLPPSCVAAAMGGRAHPRVKPEDRLFAWLGRCRRLAKDWETSIESSTAFAHVASIRMLSRRTARYWIDE
jgi:putative transposase